MKRSVLALAVLLGLLASLGCGLSRADLIATVRPEVETAVVAEERPRAQAGILTAVPTTLTAVAATQTVALLSAHGRFVTASGGGAGWHLSQEPDLTACGWFTLHLQQDGKVTLMTCYSRYVTAPKAGSTREDWLLWQESELTDCGQFVLHEVGERVALQTCAKDRRFLTAGDGGWEGDLAWSIVGETHEILDWELFTILRK